MKIIQKLISLFSNKKKLPTILSVVLVVNICFTGTTAVSGVISNENTNVYQMVSSTER